MLHFCQVSLVPPDLLFNYFLRLQEQVLAFEKEQSFFGMRGDFVLQVRHSELALGNVLLDPRQLTRRDLHAADAFGELRGAALDLERQVELDDLGQLLVVVDAFGDFGGVEGSGYLPQLELEHLEQLLARGQLRLVITTEEDGIEVQLKVVVCIVASGLEVRLDDVEHLAVLRDRA